MDSLPVRDSNSSRGTKEVCIPRSLPRYLVHGDPDSGLAWLSVLLWLLCS